MAKQVILAQGDVLLFKTDAIPPRAQRVQRANNRLIIAHSETGHHHVIDRAMVDLYQDPTDPLVAWLEVHGEDSLPNVAHLVHQRSWDTHKTLEIPVGRYEIRRQREYTPKGWQRVQD